MILYLHNFLREYYRSDEIFTKYEHDHIFTNDIYRQMAQSKE